MSEIAMFYNVENFFSPDDQVNQKYKKNSSGLNKWNKTRYNNKVYRISQVFQLIKEQEGILPFIVGLGEIQTKQPLIDLVEKISSKNPYKIIHYESKDERGMDVALLYDSSKIKLISSEAISYFFQEKNEKEEEYYDTTRDVLLCKFNYQSTRINVFVLHLPSKREKNINLSKRLHILNDLKKKINTLFDNNHEAVIIMGDFNDNPTEDYIKNFRYNNHGEKILENPFYQLFKNEIYSNFHHKQGLLFDQMILSTNFFQNSLLPLKFDKAKVFNHPKISSWDKKNKGIPFRTYSGTRYIGGYSDHFPILIKFQTNKTE